MHLTLNRIPYLLYERSSAFQRAVARAKRPGCFRKHQELMDAMRFSVPPQPRDRSVSGAQILFLYLQGSEHLKPEGVDNVRCRAWLHHLGLPCEWVSLKDEAWTERVQSFRGAGMVLAEKGLWERAQSGRHVLDTFLKRGGGLALLDPKARPDLTWCGEGAIRPLKKIGIVDRGPALTGRWPESPTRLFSPMSCSGIPCSPEQVWLTGARTSGSEAWPLLTACARPEGGKVVWCSVGMDLFERGYWGPAPGAGSALLNLLIWAFKKPLFRIAPPRGLALRIDDASYTPQAASCYQEMERSGFVPQLGVFVDQVRDWSSLAKASHEGLIEVSPHAFDTLRWIYVQSPQQARLGPEEMEQNLRRIEALPGEKGFRWASTLNAHYDVIASGLGQRLKDMGIWAYMSSFEQGSAFGRMVREALPFGDPLYSYGTRQGLFQWSANPGASLHFCPSIPYDFLNPGGMRKVPKPEAASQGAIRLLAPACANLFPAVLLCHEPALCQLGKDGIRQVLERLHEVFGEEARPSSVDRISEALAARERVHVESMSVSEGGASFVFSEDPRPLEMYEVVEGSPGEIREIRTPLTGKDCHVASSPRCD